MRIGACGLALAATVVAAMVVAACDGCKGSTRSTARDAAEKAASAAKEAAAGVAEGIEKARKETPGIDGAVVISTADELARHAELSVHAVYPDGPGGLAVVELAVRNNHTAPLRLTGLHKTGQCALMDREGFSWPLVDETGLGLGEHTILPKARQKLILRFKADAAKAAGVTVYGRAYPIDPKAISDKAPGSATRPAGRMPDDV